VPFCSLETALDETAVEQDIAVAALSLLDSSQLGSTSSDVSRRLSQVAANPGAAALAHAVRARHVADGDEWPSTFSSGEYVEILGAIRKPEFNGKRVRLYARCKEHGM
jgi:hypothetical protein